MWMIVIIFKSKLFRVGNYLVLGNFYVRFEIGNFFFILGVFLIYKNEWNN